MSAPHHLLAGREELAAGGRQGLFLKCVWAFRYQLMMQPWRVNAFALPKHAAGFSIFFFPASAT